MVSMVLDVALLCALSIFGEASAAGSPKDTTVPKWQTVVPDTGVVVPLTGPSTASVWQLHSDDYKYSTGGLRLPSDLLTNLMEAGILDDPYVDRNFLTQRQVWMGDHADAKNTQIHANRTRSWIYSTLFELPTNYDWTWYLVVEGIKMGAHIAINGVPVGTTTNQFLRYQFQVSKQHFVASSATSTTKQHNLTITFDPSITVDGRFAACSGGWDWAPYTKSDDAQGKRSYTLGIVKPIYLVAVRDVAIQHVVPKVYYKGPYPRAPMTTHANGDFEVDLEVHLNIVRHGHPFRAKNTSLVVETMFHREIVPFTITSPQITTTNNNTDDRVITTKVTFPGKNIDLWWPNGMGNQRLYDIHVKFLHQPMMIIKRIGFRTVALVTTDETDEGSFARTSRSDSEGSGSHGMYFRVNGAPVLARGANFIPMDQLEGRLLDEAHRIAVRSAADANMNMMRIWGGGMVLPDAFYEACDEYGIMLYHDMMFVDEAGHRPVETKSVEDEIRHLVRSLASHPSIVVWNGCNECQVVMGTPSEIYATFVMQTVAEEDDTRCLWPSSPSKHGWKTGVFTLDSRPNGRPLTTWGPDDFPKDLESHGPYMRSFSRDFPGVNGQNFKFPYKNTPPSLPQVPIGINLENVFSSEFGATVMSSAESMQGTLSPGHWGVHGNGPPDSCSHDYGNLNICNGTNVMAERNYPCDTHIQTYFGNVTNLDAVGEEALQEQMFHCLMAQTLWMKGEIESRRSSNLYGILIWQMNENWPTGGWGCIEYGPADKNNTQVVGGRWKPLMHLLESVLFRDVIAACGTDNQCYVRNDGMETVSAHVVFEAWDLGQLQPISTWSFSIILAADAIYRVTLPDDFTDGTHIVLINVIDNISTSQLVESTYLPSLPKDLPGIETPISVQVEAISIVDDSTVEIIVSSCDLALFVVLTTRAQGRFSENAFVLRPNQPKRVLFSPMTTHEQVDVELLRKTLRLEHLGLYLGVDATNENSNIASAVY